MSKTLTKAAALAKLQALITGLQKHFPNAQFTFGNATVTTASIIEVLQDLADAYPVVAAAQANATDAVADLRAKQAKAAPVIRDLVAYLRVTFRNATAQLGDFGVQAKARTPVAAEKRVAATAKAKATRIARGTTSKKQKLAIHGDVTGVQVTPITPSGPAASPTASTPAPAGSTAPTSTTK